MIEMSKKLTKLALAIALAVILTGGYLLFAQPKQSVSDTLNVQDSITQTSTSSSPNETTISSSHIGNSIPPNETSDETMNAVPFSQSVPKPSVPEFNVKYIDYSYDVPPTYGIDQYTGKTIMTKEGYHVNNRTVEFTINNQPFTSYKDASGNQIELYYDFRFKGPYGNEWSYYPFKPDGYSTIPYGMLTGDLSPKLYQSNTDNTAISINLDILLCISSGYTGSFTFPSGGLIEFQAQALVGHVDYESSGLIAGSYYTFTGEMSDWSETQTVTLP